MVLEFVAFVSLVSVDSVWLAEEIGRYSSEEGET
jgi:hypothetical protein